MALDKPKNMVSGLPR